ncbi:MAG TPA: phage tail protein [Trinickia sp.]|jgi:phage tail-like protein|uniref:phage tail protein n=1 Tax=Trinickia sp. TaxID=2571163 RepID=UPI002BA32664|nr:phage tail protein [Trinickia sp.]HTI18915.1 phage tail protein [Trinickia sp.]
MSSLFSVVYPPAAFYFKVEFGSTRGLSDTSFQDVSGMSAEIDTESVVEGGENRFVHQLPKGVKHPLLELKRGIAPLSSPLVTWCRSVFEMDFMAPVVAQPIVVKLLNEEGEPMRAWSFANAYPVKWEVESFNSTKNEVAIEKIALSYTYSNRLI